MGDRSTPLCTLVADDLTGACDTGAQFSTCGYSVTAALNWSLIGSCPSDVVAVTTDSRADTPAEAAGKALRAAELLHSMRGRLVFKKIDSALRGNLASEIEACLQGFDCDVCVIAPSFPSLGRQISEGWLRPPSAGAGGVHLPTLLAAQGMTAFSHVDQSWISGGVESMAIRMDDERGNGTRCFICDAVSDEQLEMAVAAAEAMQRRVLWVGSAGLARRLAKRSAEGDRDRIPPPCTPATSTAGQAPIVLVIGSDHPATVDQLERLAVCRPVVTVRAEAADSSRALRALQLGSACVLRVEAHTTGAPVLRDFFSTLEGAVRGLVLSGGDTASLACSALGVGSIRIAGEIAPGIPWGMIDSGLAHGVPVATKSGGFGATDALVAAVDFLGRCRREPEV